MRKIAKAITALVPSLVILGSVFGLEIPEVMTQTDYAVATAAVINPFAVWLVPNRGN